MKCMKIATSLKNTLDCLIMSINSTIKFQKCCGQNYVFSIKHFCVLLGQMGFHRNTVDCLKIAT